MNITGVDFVAIPVRDYERAKEFYGETLGLPFGKQWGNLPAGEFETGNLTIALMQADAFGFEFKPHTAPIAFQVDDVPEVRKQLESRGVEFTRETIDSGVCHQAIFEDPDGNVLDIHHRYAPGAPPQS